MKCQICSQEYIDSILIGFCNDCYKKFSSEEYILTITEWAKQYHPVLDDDNMLQKYGTHGRDLVEVRKLGPSNIWSVCNTGNKQTIQNGILLNDALYYLASYNLHMSTTRITVILEDGWQTQRLN